MTLYCKAIGSSQPFKLDTWYQFNPSFAIAPFHLEASSSSETPMMFNPLEWNSLYKATTLGFSFRQGPHQEAQKSIIVIFPLASFNENIFPSGVLAEKSVLHLAAGASAATGACSGI